MSVRDKIDAYSLGFSPGSEAEAAPSGRRPSRVGQKPDAVLHLWLSGEGWRP